MQDIHNDKKEFVGQVFTDLNCSADQISNKEFEGCTFDSCDFSDAAFKQCRFSDCHFIKCNLSVLKVTNSKFTNTNFSDCKILGVDWSRAYWRGMTLSSALAFTRCQLSSCSFYGLNLSRIAIKDCRAHDVDFREANFSGADFSYSDLSNSLFSNTNLAGANFNEASNYDINITKNNVKNAQFCRFEAVRLLEVIGIRLID